MCSKGTMAFRIEFNTTCRPATQLATGRQGDRRIYYISPELQRDTVRARLANLKLM